MRETAFGAAPAGPAPVAEHGQNAPVVVLHEVAKTFANGTVAIRPVTLEVFPGEFVSIVGPSGCGKSTLLRIVAGLTSATSGESSTAAGVRPGFVFQDPTLLPWRTVQGNAELLLELEHVPRSERRGAVEAALKLVRLDGFEKHYPRALSGGMRMRLSLARALALRPQLFLMDEPFAAIDEIQRELLNLELLRIWQSEGFTALFVTHNVAEAVFLSTRLLVMSPRPGRIVEEVRIPFPYPREPKLRATPEFARLAGQVSASLLGGQA